MRAFIAVDLCEKVKGRLAKLVKELELPGVKPVAPENMHITLFFLGDIDDKLRKDVEKAMDDTVMGRFRIKVKGIGAFPSVNYIRVVWAGVEGEGKLLQLYNMMKPSIRRMGFKVQDFSPHATLARVKDARSRDGVISFVKRYAEDEFGECIVDRIILKKSTLTPKGPIYEDVYERPLG